MQASFLQIGRVRNFTYDSYTADVMELKLASCPKVENCNFSSHPTSKIIFFLFQSDNISPFFSHHIHKTKRIALIKPIDQIANSFERYNIVRIPDSNSEIL